ncbi:MAG: hypothetical protein KGL93_07495 [Gemmatimonadota bacterium]|nr:hypothetical protein [Gemmatimonadota bacterium]HEU4990042.1 hypothetical protein [Gemmatimonadaceae bacterium]
MIGATMQNLAVGAALAAAALYLARRAWKRVTAARQPRSGACGPDCGCDH